MARLHPVEQPSQQLGDLGDGLPERLGVACAEVGRRDTACVKENVKIGQPGGHPFERLDRQPVDEVARAWRPPRAGRVWWARSKLPGDP